MSSGRPWFDESLFDDAAADRLGPTGDPPVLFDRPVYRAILESDALRRLRGICFLGAIDYLFHPNGRAANRRHSRYQHSLGTAELALRYARWTGLGERDEIHVATAALLHDIGRGPLAHSLEPLLERQFGLNRHAARRALLLGTVPTGAGLRRILAEHRIDAGEIAALIEETGDAALARPFRRPIDIDGIDGVLRAYGYLSPRAVVPSAFRVLAATLRREADDVRLLDRFWELKDLVHRNLIEGRAGVLADQTARRHVERRIGLLTPESCFWDDRMLRHAMPDLFPLFGQLHHRGTPTTLTEGVRQSVRIEACRCRIDPTADGSRPDQDARRYREDMVARRIVLFLPAAVAAPDEARENDKSWAAPPMPTLF